MDIKRILLIRTGALGDFVVTLPVVKALRDAWPVAHLHLVGYPGILALATGYADSMDSIDRADWASFFVPNGRLSDHCVESVRNPDLVVSYLPDADGVFGDNLRRAGARSVLSCSPHPPADGSVHFGDHLLGPLSRMGVPVADRTPHVLLTAKDRDEAEHALGECGIEGPPPIMIHPGSGSESKCWPPDRFAAVAGGVSRKSGLPVVLLSGPADGDLVRRVASYMTSPPFLVSPPSVCCLAALLERAAVYLGNDSGPSHLAAAVGVPTVVLFGPSNPRTWAPRGRMVAVLQGEPSLPPEDRLAGIGQERVEEAVLSLLAAAEYQ